MTTNRVSTYMPGSHGKRWNDLRKSQKFLHENGLIDAKFCPNDSKFYFAITKKGHELAQKILYDNHTRDMLVFCGINLAVFDDYNNSLFNILSQQVSMKEVIKL
jgi:hypothetical protein